MDFLFPALSIVALALAYVAGFCVYYDRLAFRDTAHGAPRQTVAALVLRVVFAALWPIVFVVEIVMRLVGVGEPLS